MHDGLSNHCVAVILVSYRNWGDTRKCLDALALQSLACDFIVIVNNSPGDPAPAGVLRDDVVFIEPERNLGFAGGCNLGARRAIEMGATLLWFLNTDTEPERLALQELLAVRDRNPARFGACSSVTVYQGSPDIVQWAGGSIMPLWTGVRVTANVPRAVLAGRSETHVSFVHGCSVLVDSSAFASAGGFPDDFFMYFEDAELSARLASQGYVLWNAPSSVVPHAGGGSGGGIWSSNGAYYYARNRVWFARLHGRLGLSALAAAAVHLLWSVRQRVVYRRSVPWSRVLRGLWSGFVILPGRSLTRAMLRA